MHATEFIDRYEEKIPPVVVLTGGQSFLRQGSIRRLRERILGDDESGLTRYPGDKAEWKAVLDDLRTVSMFGDLRVVIIEDADPFVSEHRAQLEKLFASPPKHGVLVLDVKTWSKSTRLAKQLPNCGLEVECTELKGPALVKWIQESLKSKYQAKIARDGASLLIELIGLEIGMIDQELAKLSTFVGSQREINVDDVRLLVGGWKAETTWAMTNGVRDGNLALSLEALDQLLTAGDAPQKLMGGIGYVFRKLAAAVDLARDMPLDSALRTSGVFPNEVTAASAYLRRIGRSQGEKILTAILDTDRGMKGGNALPDRTQLELLLVNLAGLSLPRRLLTRQYHLASTESESRSNSDTKRCD